MNLDNVLDHLENGQLVRRLSEAELAYIFKHTLTQESVYASMLKTRRAELHRAVAGALEDLYRDRLEQNAAMLALHCERAGMTDKTFTYAALAGDVAARAYAHTEAILFYERALAAAAQLPLCDRARLRKIYANRGRVLEVMGNHAAAIENYEAMIDFARRAGDVVMQADGTNRLFTAHGIMGQAHDTAAELDAAVELARRSGDPELVGRALWNIGLSTRFNDPERSIEHFVQALELARAEGLQELAAYAEIDLAAVLQLAGRWREAVEHTGRVIEMFRTLDNRPMLANALAMLGEGNYFSGRAGAARALADESARISQAIENPWGMGYSEWLLLQLDIDAGEFEDILPRAERVMRISEQLEMPLFGGLTRLSIARLQAESGQYAAARASVDAGLGLLETFGTPVWFTIATAYRGLLMLRSEQSAEAAAILEPLCTQAQAPSFNLFGLGFAGPAVAEFLSTGGRSEEGVAFCDAAIERLEKQDLMTSAAELRFWRARFRARLGDSASAEADLTSALEIAERGRNRLLLWRVCALLADVYAARGPDQVERADAARQRALEIVSTIANNIPDRAVRESFLAREPITNLRLRRPAWLNP